MKVTSQIIVRVAQMLMYEVDVQDIHHTLTHDEGLSEYEAWLAYHAGLTHNIISRRTYTEQV